MKKKNWHCIGLMSGTSLDGVDLVYTTFSEINKESNTTWDFTIIHSTTIFYPKKWMAFLKNAFYYNKEQLHLLSIEYGDYLAELILDFIKINKINTIDFIASHGHTIHHKPEENYTLQIGDGQTIANKTNLKTICSFRVQDVHLGGQGAPLVPIGDKLLFSEYEYCLNLGGFANISFDKNKERIAFDICPVNIVLNHYANKLGLDYDNHGEIAASGIINNELLTELNNLPFYKNTIPKSLGFEFVTEIIFPLIDKYHLPEKDILNTFVTHVAYQISKKISLYGKLLITGGGTFNTYLISQIKQVVTNEIVIPNNTIINFKEALIFAFLGLLKNENKINCLKSVTGATKNHCSGFVYLPQL